MPNADSFIEQAEEYLNSRVGILNDYISLLDNVSSSRQTILSLTKDKIISNIQNFISSWSTFTDTGSSFDSYAAAFVKGALDGTTASENISGQNRRALETLGSILASETKAPLYLAKKTAETLSDLLTERTSILENISSHLTKLQTNINLIDTDWYRNYLDITVSAQSDVDDAISKMLTVRSAIESQGFLNIGEIEAVKDKTLSAVSQLVKDDATASLYDMLYYIEQLETDADNLEILDEEIEMYIENLKNVKTAFDDNNNISTNVLAHARGITSSQYNELISVSKSMDGVIEKGSSALAFTQAAAWTKRLTVVAGSIDNLLVDYAETLNDSSDEDTIKFDNFISALNLPTREIDTTIPREVKIITGLSKLKLDVDLDATELNTKLNTTVNLSNDQSSSTVNIIADISDYEPTVIDSINEYLEFINTLDLDRAGAILLSSNWVSIFGLNDFNLNYSDLLSGLILSFIDSIDDIEVSSSLKSLYFKIQSEKRTRSILALTFDNLKTRAINTIRNDDLAKIGLMSGQLDSIRKKIQGL